MPRIRTELTQSDAGETQSGDMLLEVAESQHVDFPMRHRQGCMRSRAAFDLHRGKTLCVVGESGSGKSVMARSILQIVHAPRPDRRRRDPARSRRSSLDIATLSPRGLASAPSAAHDIAMIFQEPMSALSPVHTIGHQIERGYPAAPAAGRRRAARDRAVEVLDQVQHRRPRHGRTLPVRILGRHAPARHDRHGAGLQPRNC